MSIRFRLSIKEDIYLKQIAWITSNIDKDFYNMSGENRFVDFINDDDAGIFIMKFGVKKDSTKIERMIALEEMLEKMESRNRRKSKQGMGPLWEK